MYQTIDDPEDEIAAPRAGFTILPFLIGAALAGLVFFIVWLMSPGQATTAGRTIDSPASRAAYLKALAEPNAAFRRARLLDYQRAYPDTDRTKAIEDQLDVINAVEQTDWEIVTRRVYDERATLDDKRGALAYYESQWSGRLLGGRGEELETLRRVISESAEAEPLPDRSLDTVKSPIPTTIPSDRLAGAPPRMAATFPIPERVRPDPEPVVQAPTEVVVQPKIRRNVTPRYPRAAQRRNIGAVVTLTMNIDEKGRVAMTEIINVEAERYEKEFSRAAKRAAMRTRFHPKTVDGEAVSAIGVRKRYIFRSN